MVSKVYVKLRLLESCNMPLLYLLYVGLMWKFFEEKIKVAPGIEPGILDSSR